MKTKVFFMFFALTMMSVSLYAQTAKSTSTKQETQKSCYVDANNNGVCDNYENKTCKKENGKHDGKGNCANKGKGDCCKVETKKGCCNNGAGAKFEDKNNNSVCDNKE